MTHPGRRKLLQASYNACTALNAGKRITTNSPCERGGEGGSKGLPAGHKLGPLLAAWRDEGVLQDTHDRAVDVGHVRCITAGTGAVLLAEWKAPGDVLGEWKRFGQFHHTLHFQPGKISCTSFTPTHRTF